MEWETVIGLEIHIQLLTRSKIFSGASTTFGAEPNTQACTIDLGLPGVLPVPNEETVRMAVKFGLSIDAEINKRSIFARKNYFYPDLPKGYQITQDSEPIIKNGQMPIYLENGSQKYVGILRAHLEEDAGKSVHGTFNNKTGIDLNRAGTPLLEIVSHPDMRSAFEAVAYLKNIHTLVQHLGICDGNMQEGSFRCDANVSVRRKGEIKLGTRTEIKNINSFRFVERAINYEVKRQIDAITAGENILLETRLYDPDKNETRSMRPKEDAHLYRYFPDPDLLPVVLSDEYINIIKQSLPELPQQKCARFQNDYSLSAYDANILANNKSMADYYENIVHIIAAKTPTKTSTPAINKLTANWVTGDLLAALNKENLKINQSPIKEERLAGMLEHILDDSISGKIAKIIFETMWQEDKTAEQIISEKNLIQITDTSALEAIIDQIIAAHPTQLADYRAGKDKLLGFFVGEVMKASQGKANPKQLNALLMEKLKG